MGAPVYADLNIQPRQRHPSFSELHVFTDTARTSGITIPQYLMRGKFTHLILRLCCLDLEVLYKPIKDYAFNSSAVLFGLWSTPQTSSFLPSVSHVGESIYLLRLVYSILRTQCRESFCVWPSSYHHAEIILSKKNFYLILWPIALPRSALLLSLAFTRFASISSEKHLTQRTSYTKVLMSYSGRFPRLDRFVHLGRLLNYLSLLLKP